MKKNCRFTFLFPRFYTSIARVKSQLLYIRFLYSNYLYIVNVVYLLLFLNTKSNYNWKTLITKFMILNEKYNKNNFQL